MRKLLLFNSVFILAAAAVCQSPRWSTVGTITNGASTVSITSRDYAFGVVTIHGTYAGVSVVFEVSDDAGVTWYPNACARTDLPIMETGEAVATNANLAWNCPLAATTTFRVRATSWTSGTASVGITASQDQIEPVSAVSGTVSPNLDQRVMAIPKQKMEDGFDGGALDTTNRWNAPVTSGTGNSVTVTGGNLVVALGANIGYAYVTSQPNFQDPTPGQTRYAYNVQVETTPYAAATYRFWGAGFWQAAPTTAGCPACTNTIADGIGTELNTDGHWYFVRYAAGVRTVLADITASGPVDGGAHNMPMWWRAASAQTYIDTEKFGTPVASTGVSGSALGKDALPATAGAVQGGSTPANLTINTMSVSDTSGGGASICDPTFGWRCATVKAANTPATITDPASVVTLSPAGDPCNEGTRKTSAVVNIASATTTELVALSAGKQVYLCSVAVSAAGTSPSIQFVTGGAACAAPTVLTGTILANAGLNTIGWGGTIATGIVSDDLCLVSGGTTPSIQGVITYIQQ